MAKLLSEGMARKTTRFLATLIPALAAAALLLPAGPAKAAWTVKGGGFGHGVGMSAYGAFGMAKHGWNHKKILRHYYRGTRIGKLQKSRSVGVLLDVKAGNVYFSGAKLACGRKLASSRTYGARLVGKTVRLINSNGKGLENCGRRLKTGQGGRTTIRGLGKYRGGLRVVPAGSTSGSLNVINLVSINDYVKGVVPNESIPSWPMAALRAQAVASRSFALSGGVGGKGFDLYSDTRSQVYGPVSTEYERTNKAAAQTSSQLVMYKKQVALTVFSASSGGHTENVENIWFGDPVPYLKGVRDPFDGVSPYHRWSKSFSNSAIRNALEVKGRLKRVKITKYGVSKRIIWARLYGMGGVSKIRGDTLQYALGLPDRLVFSIKKGSAGKTSASQARSLPAGNGTVPPSTLPSAAPTTTSEG